MAGILKRRHYRASTNDLVFREHRIQPHRVGDRHRSKYLAGIRRWEEGLRGRFRVGTTE